MGSRHVGGLEAVQCAGGEEPPGRWQRDGEAHGNREAGLKGVSPRGTFSLLRGVTSSERAVYLQ